MFFWISIRKKLFYLEILSIMNIFFLLSQIDITIRLSIQIYQFLNLSPPISLMVLHILKDKIFNLHNHYILNSFKLNTQVLSIHTSNSNLDVNQQNTNSSRLIRNRHCSGSSRRLSGQYLKLLRKINNFKYFLSRFFISFFWVFVF